MIHQTQSVCDKCGGEGKQIDQEEYVKFVEVKSILSRIKL